jgi:hypothetical protein
MTQREVIGAGALGIESVDWIDCSAELERRLFLMMRVCYGGDVCVGVGSRRKLERAMMFSSM